MTSLTELQKYTLHLTDCLSFSEVAKIVSPILGTTDFMWFMENYRYLIDGVPNNYHMNKKMFKVVSRVDRETDMSHSISIFITKIGLEIIVQKALRHYRKMHIFAN